MKLTMLGTGAALVTKVYNTCFVLQNQDDFLLVDGGGGNQLFNQLEKSAILWSNLKNVIVTHKHIDHILGIVWLVRKVCQAIHKNKYRGNFSVYGAEGVIEIFQNILELLLQKKETQYIGSRVFLNKVKDGQVVSLLGGKVQFFDIHSNKALQYGFILQEQNRKLVCFGDEPASSESKILAQNADWVLHEAFCKYSDRNTFKPYEKNHSTVKEACELANEMKVKNLVLYHTEDTDIAHRKEEYLNEGKNFYKGNLFVPNDLEKINLW